MSHFYVRVVQLSFLLLTAILLVIHAQPFDDHEVRQALLPDDCPAPCFLGIRPGMTNGEDAVTLLQASRWVGEIDDGVSGNQQGFIRWDWSDQKPAWINGSTQGKIWATQKRVVTIIVYGAFQLGNTRLSLGSPDQEVIDRSADRRGQFSLYSASYGQAGLIIQSWQPCNVLEPLRRPVILTYTLPADPKSFPQMDSLAELQHTCAYQRP